MPARHLPPAIAAEAARLLQEVRGEGRGDIHGDGELGLVLAEPSTRSALGRQGVRAAELLACTARGTSAETRARATTALAQVLWDAELHAQRPRPVRRPTSAPGPRPPISRPQSAREARHHRLAMHMQTMDERLVSRARADQAAEDFRTLRCAQHVEVLGQIHEAKVAQTDAWKRSEAQRLAELARLSEERHAAIAERTFQQNVSERCAHQSRMTSANDEHADAAEYRRNEMILEGRAVEHERSVRSASAHAGARARQQIHLENRRCGPPQMRFKENSAVRDWQGARLDRLRQMERSKLQERLDRPPADPPIYHH